MTLQNKLAQKMNCTTFWIYRFRGAILASCILPNFLGQMIALGGSFFLYDSSPILWFVILITVIVTSSLYHYFPETPLWLMKNKRFEVRNSSWKILIEKLKSTAQTSKTTQIFMSIFIGGWTVYPFLQKYLQSGWKSNGNI